MKQLSALRGATVSQRRGMASAIACQCLGSFSVVFIGNGLLLLYLLALDFSETLALALTSGFQVMNFLSVFFAHWAERRGLKKIGILGLILNIFGLAIMGFVYYLPKMWQVPVMTTGIVVFALGKPAMTGIWFPLLRGIVPSDLIGRFFGVLRFSWQLVGLGFLAVCPFLVGEGGPAIYSYLLGGIVLTQILRIFLFSLIPEAKKNEKTEEALGMTQALNYAIHWPGLASFCSYVFLLCLATGMSHQAFALTEKTVLNLPDSTVVWLGNLGLFGTILGALWGGMIIDRFGTKVVFLVAHFGLGVLMFLFVARGGVPIPTLWVLGVCHGLVGLLGSSVALAITTEMYSLEPDKGKNVAFSLMNSCVMLGFSLSGLLGAGAIKMGLFSDRWAFLGEQMGPYDAILLLLSGVVMLLVVTLCLVPSVLKIKPHRFIPQT